MITTTTISTIRIGLVKWNEPMLKIGLKSKLSKLGEGKPHPEKMGHPLLLAATADTLPITGQLLSHRWRLPLVFSSGRSARSVGRGSRASARNAGSAAGWIGRTGR